MSCTEFRSSNADSKRLVIQFSFKLLSIIDDVHETQSRKFDDENEKSAIGWEFGACIHPMFPTQNQILHRSRLSRPRTISIKRIHMLLQMLMNWIVVKRLVLKWLYYNISDRFVDN